MLIQHHAITGAIAVAIFYPIFGVSALLILIAAVFADIDHLLIYIYRFKKFDLKNAYNYFRKIKDGSSFYPAFHMFETFSIILFFSIYFNCIFLKLISIGMIVHIVHDLFEELFLRPTDRNFFGTKFLLE